MSDDISGAPDVAATQVLVTGCDGYIGAWIAAALMRAGYRVRGTTIDVAGARALFTAAFSAAGEVALLERLDVVFADLMDPQVWTTVTAGCTVAIHTAGPVVTEPGTPAAQLHDPVVVGTEHVVLGCAAAGTVRHFVHTSSITALLDHHRPIKPRPALERIGPGDWNETASPVTDPYAHAKVKAEREARALVASQMPGATFTSMVPGPVIGPPLAGQRVPASLDKTMAPFLSGQLKAGSIALSLGVVDARDVGQAYLKLVDALCAPGGSAAAGGRYILVARPVMSLQSIADVIAKHFPQHRRRLPRRALPLPRPLLLAAMRWTVTEEAYSYTRAMLGRTLDYDTSDTEQVLGVQWRTHEQTIVDTVRWLDARASV